MIGKGFVEKYYTKSHEKKSCLCVGLDPVTHDMRDRYVIPHELTKDLGDMRAIKKFCLDVVDAVAPYTPIIKPNAQFLIYALSFKDLKEIVDAIHFGGCLALLDIKLTDIGSTNQAGLHWIDRLGFDAVTFSPFQGFKNGSDAVYRWAEENDKGIFALCRMSNPGADDYQTKPFGEDPFYVKLARDAHDQGCNGYVVGCTAPSELGKIRGIIGDEPLILSPGFGAQGGDPKAAMKLGGNSHNEGLIISSSRSIDFAYESPGWEGGKYAKAAAEAAKRKRDELNEILRSIF